jgi:hypothetical protein
LTLSGYPDAERTAEMRGRVDSGHCRATDTVRRGDVLLDQLITEEHPAHVEARDAKLESTI